MIQMDGPDRFEVANGPEDGTEFPITRSPIDLGTEQSCGVYLHFEASHPRQHARVTAVSDGYRIRCLGRGEISVDGKKAGLLRSRVVRDGGIVRVGSTELCLVIAPDGVARRSRGLPTESDAVWFARYAIKHTRRTVKSALHIVSRAPWIIGRYWLIILIAVGVAAYFVPEYRIKIIYWARYLWREIQAGIRQIRF